jgi:hypothetical protein
VSRWLSRDPIEESGGLNLYGYAGNSPVSFFDPLGLCVEVPSDLKDEYSQVKEYLKGTPAGKILDDLEKDPNYTVTLKRFSGRDYYDSDRRTIDWDPSSGIRTPDGKGLSPATALGHEADHANYDRTNPRGYKAFNNAKTSGQDKGYDTLEERRVIQGSESATARMKGEGIRTGHNGGYYPVSGPTKR